MQLFIEPLEKERFILMPKLKKNYAIWRSGDPKAR